MHLRLVASAAFWYNFCESIIERWKASLIMVDEDTYNSEDFPFAELKSDNEHEIKLTSYGYQHNNEESGWDADWQVVGVTIRVPGFSGKMNTSFAGNEIQVLMSDLNQFNQVKLRQVSFEPMEPWLVLEFTFGRRHQVCVKGVTEYPLGYGSKLMFEFETDLSFIDRFIHGLKRILEKYPSRNS